MCRGRGRNSHCTVPTLVMAGWKEDLEAMQRLLVKTPEVDSNAKE